MTATVGLALLMEKYPPAFRFIDGKDIGKNTDIRKAADWLVERSETGRDGLIFSGHASESSRYMHGHGLATLFLAGVWRHETDATRQKRIAATLGRAVQYTVKARSTQGGWYHTSRVEGHDFADVLSTAIQMQALRAAQNAGIPFPFEVLNDASDSVETALGEEPAPPKTCRARIELAAAIALRTNSRSRSRFSSPTVDGIRGEPDETAVAWVRLLEADLVDPRPNETVHYYLAQGLYDNGHDRWAAYQSALFDRLRKTQREDGSWSGDGGDCLGDGFRVGPLYATAVWCTVLQLERRSHPSRQFPKVRIGLAGC